MFVRAHCAAGRMKNILTLADLVKCFLNMEAADHVPSWQIVSRAGETQIESVPMSSDLDVLSNPDRIVSPAK